MVAPGCETAIERPPTRPFPLPAGPGRSSVWANAIDPIWPVKFWSKNSQNWSGFATFLGCHTPRGRCQIAATPPKGGSAICQSARAKKKGAKRAKSDEIVHGPGSCAVHNDTRRLSTSDHRYLLAPQQRGHTKSPLTDEHQPTNNGHARSCLVRPLVWKVRVGAR
jgi:hypothetical protein